jgi:hypothetical protein
VAVVFKSFLLSRRAERLAGARTCPHWPIVGPSCPAQGIAPNSDTGEKMALGKPGKVAWHNIGNAPLVNLTRRDMTCLDEFTQPRGCKWVNFVVVGSHYRATP